MSLLPALALWTLGCDRSSPDSQPPAPTDSSGTDTSDSTPDSDPPTGSAGCGAETLSTGVHTLQDQGLTRTFRVLVPASHDPDTPAPLVLAFHGWGGDQDEFLGSAVVRDAAEDRGVVVVAPLGLGGGQPDRSWASWAFSGSTTGRDGDGDNTSVPGDSLDICHDDATTDYTYGSCAGVADNGCSWTHCQADDVDFVVALLETVTSGLCIDPQAVFATGGSNGGMFTWELGQDARTAHRFRALAPLIGLPHRGYLASKATDDDLAVLSITGTRDPTVPPGAWDDPSFTTTTDGDRYFYTGATAITAVWAQAHGCETSQPAAPFGAGVPDLDCRTWCPTDSGWPDVLDCRADMRHTYDLRTTWPLILDFFDAHR